MPFHEAQYRLGRLALAPTNPMLEPSPHICFSKNFLAPCPPWMPPPPHVHTWSVFIWSLHSGLGLIKFDFLFPATRETRVPAESGAVGEEGR